MTKKISELTAGAAVADAHLFESSQASLSTKVTATQLKTYFLAGFTAAGLAMGGAASAAAQTALLSNFIGDSGAGGTKGLVPAPAAGDAAAGRFLKSDGTWAVPAGGGATQAFGTIVVSGQSDIVADAAPDTLTIVAGANVTLTTNAGTDTLTIAAAGGSGSPGGSDTQVQFNDGGAFGGDSGFTFNKTTNLATLTGTDGASSLLIASGSQTGSSSPALSITQTWNNAATTFTGILVNITNTASATASMLLDLQVGGSSKFYVRKNGDIYNGAGSIYTSGGFFLGGPDLAFAGLTYSSGPMLVTSTSVGVLSANATRIQLRSDTSLSWANSTTIGEFGTSDTSLSRNAAGVVQFGTTTANASGAWLALNGTLGTAGAATGSLKLAHVTSAFLTTIQAGNAAAARTYVWPTNFGSAGFQLTDAAGDGVLSWAAAGSGGGGTPGGADTQVQFNDGGAFGGDAGLTFNKTTNALTVTGILALDSGGGSTSAPNITFGPVGTATGFYRGATGHDVLYSSNGGNAFRFYGLGNTSYVAMYFNSTAQFASGQVLGWSSTTTSDDTPDVFIGRNAAATLRLGNPNVDLSANVVAQTLTTQGLLAGGTTNQAGKDFTILVSPGKGTGAGGQLVLQTTPAGASSTSINAAATGLTITAPAVNMQPSCVLGNQAIATTATDGFLYAVSGAGTPTGVPTTFTGRVPIYIDTTNSQLWLYLAGAWKQPKTPAGAALVTWQ